MLGYLWSMDFKARGSEASNLLIVIGVFSIALFALVWWVGGKLLVNDSAFVLYLVVGWAVCWGLNGLFLITAWLKIRPAMFRRTYTIIFINGLLQDYVWQIEKDRELQAFAATKPVHQSAVPRREAAQSMIRTLERFIRNYARYCEAFKAKPYIDRSEYNRALTVFGYVLKAAGLAIAVLVVVEMISWLGWLAGVFLSWWLIALAIAAEYSELLQMFMLETVVRKALTWELLGPDRVGSW